MNAEVHSVTAYEEVVDALKAGLVVVDGEGMVQQANRRAHEILAAEQLHNTTIELWFSSGDELKQLAREHRRAKRIVERDGTTNVVVGFTVTPLRLSRDDTSYAVVFQDITEVERLRDERDRLMRMAAVSEILPSLLHELKNPLASIAAAVELTLEELPEGQTQTDLHAILTEIRRMKLTLEGLGSVGRDLRSSRHHAIDHASREVCRVLQRQATSRSIVIHAHINDMPLLPLDPGVTRAILFNLVTNAIHACSPGDSITVSGQLDPKTQVLTLSVEDTGSGMPQEVLERCRELFYTTKTKGTGIGLALCAGAIETAHGELCINSTPGKGTCVSMRIPANNRRLSGELSVGDSIIPKLHGLPPLSEHPSSDPLRIG